MLARLVGDQLIGTHFHASVRRAIAAVVAVAILAQNAACVRLPARPDERACAEEKAEILSRAKDNVERAIFFNVTFDSQWRCAAFVRQGFYSVSVSVTWPDGSTKESLLVEVFGVKPGRQYSVQAYQVGVGHVPAIATLIEVDPKTTGTSTGGFNFPSCGGNVIGLLICAPIIVGAIVLVIIASPFYIVSAIRGQPDRSTPGSGRHLWIEDASTGQIIFSQPGSLQELRNLKGEKPD